jgi:hypothetical protein
LLLASGTLATGLSNRIEASQALPSSCGSIGTAGYSASHLPTIPPLTSAGGVVVTVTTNSDAVNGDTSSVQALMKDPGPDGISLREAIDATNNSPGTYTIRFDPSLNGSKIIIGTAYLMLGGNVAVIGNLDRDGGPEITVAPSSQFMFPTPFQVSSGGNTVFGLRLLNFTAGVAFSATSAGQVFSDNSIRNLSISSTSSKAMGIGLGGGWQQYDHDTWTNMFIIGNAIRVTGTSIFLSPTFVTGNEMINTEILDNSLASTNPNGGLADALDFMIGFGGGTHDEGINTTIAYNTIQDWNSFGMQVTAGGIFNNDSILNGVQIVDNHILTFNDSYGSGINLQPGGEAQGPQYGYPSNNVVENVSILGNVLVGSVGSSIDMGKLSGANNSLLNVDVEGNSISKSWFGPISGQDGIRVHAGSFPGSGNSSVDNVISNVTIRFNNVVLVNPSPGVFSPGVLVLGGFGASSNTIKNLAISNNIIDSGTSLGISVIGGFSGKTQTLRLGPADFNVVVGTQITCNSIATTEAVQGPETSGILVIAGFSTAGEVEANIVSDMLLSNNLVGGVLNDVSVYNQYGSGATRNSVVLNAASVVNATTLVTTTATMTTSSTIAITTSNTTTTTPTTILTQSSSTTTSGTGGVPEFPFQWLVVTVFTTFVVIIYLIVRRRA